MAYITRDDLLAALTETHEKTIAPALFGGASILIRELTARQRTQANEAALRENPDVPDNSLYRAMLIQMSVVDPESGSADDPRTRTPLLTIDDVLNIADGRDEMTNTLVSEITSLSLLAPRHLFPSNKPADRPQRDAHEGAELSGSGDRKARNQRTGPTDIRAALSGEQAGGVDASTQDVE